MLQEMWARTILQMILAAEYRLWSDSRPRRRDADSIVCFPEGQIVGAQKAIQMQHIFSFTEETWNIKRRIPPWSSI